MNENNTMLNTNEEENSNSTNSTEVEKKFTQEELDSIIAKRVAKERKNIEVEKKLLEEEKLEKMSTEEKLKHDLQAQKKEIEELKLRARRNELKDQAQGYLNENGIDVNFAKFLVNDNEQEMQNQLQEFKEAWDSALKSATTKAIATKTPDAIKKSSEMTTADFEKLSVLKQQEIYRTNPGLYKNLTGQI